MDYRAIVVGASAGGFEALGQVLTKLPESFPLPIIIVQHNGPQSDGYFIKHFDQLCRLAVKEVEEKEKAIPGTVYFAPPNYHILMEEDETFSLSTDERVNYSRPSIDVLFDSSACVYGSELVGVILSGANNDGAAGLKRIKERGGLAIVQDPETAYVSSMPQNAIKATTVDYILPLKEIGEVLCTLCV